MDIRSVEFDELYARLDDLMGRAVRGEPGISAFFSPRELRYAQMYLRAAGADFFSLGGYPDAERQRIVVLPEYMAGIDSADELKEYGYESGIAAIKAVGSGFESLSHRTFMGSLLGLGLKRSIIGDIVMIADNEAVVFCECGIVEFLLTHWDKAGRDKIKLFVTDPDSVVIPPRKYSTLSDTVASPRLDCIVAALCSLSREKAKETITSGAVELEYECEERPDREVCPPCVISVRGYGKFRVVSVSDKTKKGRYRLMAEKFL